MKSILFLKKSCYTFFSCLELFDSYMVSKNLKVGQYKMEDASCRFIKPGVPRGPASTPGLGPGKQHTVHGPAQESKKQRAGRAIRSSTGRSTHKNKCPFDSFFGPPLRPKHSLRVPAVSKRSLQSEGLAQNSTSYFDPATPAPRLGLVGTLPTALLRPVH